MRNPQEIISPRTMFLYDNHLNIPWNLTQYQPLKHYLDPLQIFANKKYLSQKKGVKDNKYKTKKGFYMDYDLKVAGKIPASNKYAFKDTWQPTEENKRTSMHRNVNSSLSKYTYLDRIEMEQKNRHKPAPNTYNPNKTLQEINKEKDQQNSKQIKLGQKRFYYEDTYFLSNQSPGAGSYNPYKVKSKSFRLDKSTVSSWKKKHQLYQEKEQKKNNGPSAITYRPIPTAYRTFQQLGTINNDSSKDSKKKLEKTGFGTDAKFAYDRPNKKVIIEKRPDPGDHNLIIQWQGKNMSSTSSSWIKRRSSGFNQTIYH